MWCSNLQGAAAAQLLLGLKNKAGLSGALLREMLGRESGKPTASVDECVPQFSGWTKNGFASA